MNPACPSRLRAAHLVPSGRGPGLARLAAISLLTIAAAGDALEAQANGPALGPLEAGSRVRITMQDRRRREGTIQSVSTDSIVLFAGNEHVALPKPDIRTFERYSHRARNFKWGFVGGLLAGAGLGALMHKPNTIGPPPIVVLAPLGALTGTLIGAVKTDRWVAQPIP